MGEESRQVLIHIAEMEREQLLMCHTARKFKLFIKELFMRLFPLYQFLTVNNDNYEVDTDRDEFSLVYVKYTCCWL